MTELSDEERILRNKNYRLAAILGSFVICTILMGIINFYYSGLPKDANRMRERFKQRSAQEAQNLAEALQNAEAAKDTTSSEVVE